jgi:hypothetical protein
LVVIECGAGLVIPSSRVEAEDVAAESGGGLIRINPVDCMVPGVPSALQLDRKESPAQSIGLPMGSAGAMAEIMKRVLEMQAAALL